MFKGIFNDSMTYVITLNYIKENVLKQTRALNGNFIGQVTTLEHIYHAKEMFKGIFNDFHNMLIWHESEDINQKSLFPKFQLIPILRFQVMHDYVCSLLP